MTTETAKPINTLVILTGVAYDRNIELSMVNYLANGYAPVEWLTNSKTSMKMYPGLYRLITEDEIETMGARYQIDEETVWIDDNIVAGIDFETMSIFSQSEEYIPGLNTEFDVQKHIVVMPPSIAGKFWRDKNITVIVFDPSGLPVASEMNLTKYRQVIDTYNDTMRLIKSKKFDGFVNYVN